MVSFIDPLPVLVTSDVAGNRGHLKVLADCSLSLCCVFILLLLHVLLVVPTCNVKTTLITIIIVVIIVSCVGVFLWIMRPPIVVCKIGVIIVAYYLSLLRVASWCVHSLWYHAVDVVSNMVHGFVSAVLFGMSVWELWVGVLVYCLVIWLQNFV